MKKNLKEIKYLNISCKIQSRIPVTWDAFLSMSCSFARVPYLGNIRGSIIPRENIYINIISGHLLTLNDLAAFANKKDREGGGGRIPD